MRNAHNNIIEKGVFLVEDDTHMNKRINNIPSTAIKDKLLEEVNRLPEDKLVEVYNFIHHFRLETEKNMNQKEIDLMSFFGAWKDMDDAISDITDR